MDRWNAPGSDPDEVAIARYRYLLRTAPPEAIEAAHREAFAQLTPDQRRRVLEGLAAGVDPVELRGADDSPERLARLATRAELRQPGSMERTFGGAGWSGSGGWGGAGGGFGGSFLGMLAGAFVGTSIASMLFPGDALSAEGAGDPGTGDGGWGDPGVDDPGRVQGGEWGNGGDAGGWDGGDGEFDGGGFDIGL